MKAPRCFSMIAGLMALPLSLLGHMPKVDYEFTATYEDRGIFSRKGSKLSGVCIDGEVYEPVEVFCESGPVCFYYYRVLKHDKAKRPLTEEAETWLQEKLLKVPMVRSPALSDSAAQDAYEFRCVCVKWLEDYRLEAGRLFMEYKDNSEDVARLQSVCNVYNKVIGSQWLKRVRNARGRELDKAKLGLLEMLIKPKFWREQDDRYLFVLQSCSQARPYGGYFDNVSQSDLMSAIEAAYEPLIDKMLNKIRSADSEKEGELRKKEKRELRRVRKLAEEANEMAIAAKIQADQNSGENSDGVGFVVIPSTGADGEESVRVIGNGGVSIKRTRKK